MVTDRPSLGLPDLDGFWEAVRARLERAGTGHRGRIGLPPHQSARARHILSAVLDGPVRATVDLQALEDALRRLGVGATLPGALAALGHPVSSAPGARRAARRAGDDARSAARHEVAAWPDPWAVAWIDGVIRARILAGLDTDSARRLVRDTRTVLDHLGESAGRDAGDPLSRVDLAAKLLGSSHALDRGTRAEAAVTRALRHRYPGLGDREVWERAGAHLDLVSAPVLTWGLRAPDTSPVHRLLDAAAELALPVHLSQLALRSYPVLVDPGIDILVTENPRIVEAAAESASPTTVVALNGNPSGAARLLLDQLLGGGAALRYHGDFDAAGLRICARMHRLGLVPWRMDVTSYAAALAEADASGAPLPTDPFRSPPTPWDPDLQAAFDRHRRIVHEERLLPGLLDGDGTTGHRSGKPAVEDF